MKLFFKMLAINFNTRFGLSMIKYNYKYDRKTFNRNFWMILILSISFAYLLTGLCFLLNFLFDAFISIGQGKLLLSIAVLSSVILTLVVGIFMVLGSLFFAKDSALLASMPIKPATVFASKFTFVYINEIITSAVIVLPAAIIYGIKAGEGVWFYLMLLPVLIAVPALPLIISTLISLLVMNIVGRIRSRGVFAMIVTLIVVILYFVGYTMLMNKMAANFSADQLINAISHHIDLFTAVGSAYPPANWAIQALTGAPGTSLLQYGLLLGISAAGLALVVMLSNVVYYRGALAHLEAPQRTRARAKAVKSVRRSAAASLFKRDLLSIMRVPIFAMNCLAGAFIMPILIIIMLAMNMAGTKSALLPFIGSAAAQEYVLAGLIAILGFFASVNTAAGTIISREGKGFFILKSLPIKARDLFVGKTALAYLLSAVPTSIVYIVLMIYLPMRLDYYLIGLIVNLSMAAIMVEMSALLDMYIPKLNWDNPQYVVKQSFNALAPMLFGLSIVVIIGVITYLLSLVTGLYAAFLLACVLLIAAAVVFYHFIIKKAEGLLARI